MRIGPNRGTDAHVGRSGEPRYDDRDCRHRLAATDRERKSSIEMTKDYPWRDPDPQPGDFDAELHHSQIENPNAKLSILVSVEGDDAKRLERIDNERSQ